MHLQFYLIMIKKTENAANKAVKHLQKISEKKEKNPIILVNQAPTATLVEETMNKITFSVQQCLEKGKKSKYCRN